MFDSKQFKQQFPIFSHPENERLVYLDNAATTQRPQVVVDAIADFYTRSNANTHRSSHRLARQATEQVEQVRARLR
ncbi:MAG: aminotransferase class V-fold PLP-dependent enzyme, partial [Pseudomonadota bacterium]